MTEKELIARIKENEKIMNERVLIELPYDRVHKDQMVVGVNAYNAIIPRGKACSIPRYAAEVIRQSQQADFEMAIKIEEMQKSNKAL